MGRLLLSTRFSTLERQKGAGDEMAIQAWLTRVVVSVEANTFEDLLNWIVVYSKEHDFDNATHVCVTIERMDYKCSATINYIPSGQ